MSFEIKLDSEKYDDATMRLSCASSLLTLLGAQYDGEGCMYSDSVINHAVYGIGLLVEDACKQLAR